MRQDKTTGTVKPVPVFYAVLCVGRILSLSRTSFYDPVCCFVFFFGVNKKKHIHAARTLSPLGICRRAAKSGHSDRLHCLGKVKFVHCFSVTKKSILHFFLSFRIIAYHTSSQIPRLFFPAALRIPSRFIPAFSITRPDFGLFAS